MEQDEPQLSTPPPPHPVPHPLFSGEYQKTDGFVLNNLRFSRKMYQKPPPPPAEMYQKNCENVLENPQR